MGSLVLTGGLQLSRFWFSGSELKTSPWLHSAHLLIEVNMVTDRQMCLLRQGDLEEEGHSEVPE